MMSESGNMAQPHHDDVFVRELFDKMGPTYGITNVVTSFGFSEWWRYACVNQVSIEAGETVCDMMAGSGECWRYLPKQSVVLSIDFSSFMVEKQHERNEKRGQPVDVRCESALATSIESQSVDVVVSAFGLKTLSRDATRDFAQEISRILKPGGKFSLIEISVPQSSFLKVPYEWYLRKVIPLFGKFCLSDIECYRMLGIYTREFESCARVLPYFCEAGLDVTFSNHFFGCATSLSGTKK